MINDDTIKLLRECDAGTKMGISSIDDVLDYVRDGNLKSTLKTSKDEHTKLKDEIELELNRFHDEGKEPNIMAKGMSWMKTNTKLSFDSSDKTIADLITDGCDMGVKSLCRYLNQYAAADEKSKDITKKLISLEERLGTDMQCYL